jgi:hypothetical protein
MLPAAMLPAHAAALAATETAFSSILLVNRFAAFSCTLELRSTTLDHFLFANPHAECVRKVDGLVALARPGFAVRIACAKLVAARCHAGPMGTHDYEVRPIAHCGCSVAYIVKLACRSCGRQTCGWKYSKSSPSKDAFPSLPQPCQATPRITLSYRTLVRGYTSRWRSVSRVRSPPEPDPSAFFLPRGGGGLVLQVVPAGSKRWRSRLKSVCQRTEQWSGPASTSVSISRWGFDEHTF